MRWHRMGFAAYWRWKSRPCGGWPRIGKEVRDLIRRMSLDPLWGAPKIHGELLKLGIDVAQSTASISMVPRKGRPERAVPRTLSHIRSGGLHHRYARIYDFGSDRCGAARRGGFYGKTPIEERVECNCFGCRAYAKSRCIFHQ